MITITTKKIILKKLFPFTISRGTRSESDNLLVYVSDGIHTGIGEFDSTIIGNQHLLPLEQAATLLNQFFNKHNLSTLSIHEIWQLANENQIPKHVLAGLDMALWDLKGKQCGLPLYQLFGLSKQSVATSITIGITPIEIIPERIHQLLSRHPFKYLKIKLGAKDGIEYDKQAFLAIKAAANPFNVKLRVDANGGWSLDDARIMLSWLQEHGVDYVEQPLSIQDDERLPALFKSRPLPIFIDESCCTSQDIPRFAHCVDGINLKLMKSGGLTEALRMVATARAHGLKTMIGCMSESSIAISAAASIGSLFDYIDLDSHLNLNPDPAKGAMLIDGAITPTDTPGHGAALC